MTSQLTAVLDRFINQSGPLSVAQMAREMRLEPGVLDSMINYWVRKGKLREISGSSDACAGCGGKHGCPYVVALPRYYELVSPDDPQTPPPCACGGACKT
ncbi:MAG: hypothetical protein J0L63_13645 [Anaerolineae bacterium]|nr:hypothetical protein [Anaerolineae bacterium]MBN8619949.1 hypothetical protein [Anaerolineae bacterium]